MWETALGVSSFVVMPIVFVFMVYATLHLVFTFNWHLFVIALIIFAVAVCAHIVIGIIAEG